MRQHADVTSILAEAAAQQRCAVATNNAVRCALRRRRRSGEIISPHRGLYIEASCWNALNECQQIMYVTRALTLQHPEWVFAGLTAADIYGFWHARYLHNNAITIADQYHAAPRSHRSAQSLQVSNAIDLNRICMTQIPVINKSGLLVTSPERTLVDCALRIPFEYALGMFDCALRQKISPTAILTECSKMKANCSIVQTLLHYADAASENGGESLVRGVIILEGFAVPELQVEFYDPDCPATRFRVDYIWRLHDGRLIVLEFDGMQKYTNPRMTNKRTVEQVVGDQMERDNILRQFGVTKIIHCTYKEAMQRTPLVVSLRNAGVPWPGYRSIPKPPLA